LVSGRRVVVGIICFNAVALNWSIGACS